MRDTISQSTYVTVIDPVSFGNGDSEAVELDLQGWNGVEICFHVGLASGLSGSNYMELTLDDADDDGTGSAGTYANVDTADMIGVTPASGVCVTVDADGESEAVYTMGYVGGKRFLRVSLTETGTLPDVPVSCVARKGLADFTAA